MGTWPARLGRPITGYAGRDRSAPVSWMASGDAYASWSCLLSRKRFALGQVRGRSRRGCPAGEARTCMRPRSRAVVTSSMRPGSGRLSRPPPRVLTCGCGRGTGVNHRDPGSAEVRSGSGTASRRRNRKPARRHRPGPERAPRGGPAGSSGRLPGPRRPVSRAGPRTGAGPGDGQARRAHRLDLSGGPAGEVGLALSTKLRATSVSRWLVLRAYARSNANAWSVSVARRSASLPLACSTMTRLFSGLQLLRGGLAAAHAAFLQQPDRRDVRVAWPTRRCDGSSGPGAARRGTGSGRR